MKMKKIISYILVAIFAISFTAFLNMHFSKAKGADEKEIYETTNTYNISKIEKEKDVEGYVDKQYNIIYNMGEKTDNAVASTTPVTVLTHGYNSSGKDWLNNSPNWQFNYEYSNDSLVDKIVKLHGVEKCVLLLENLISIGTPCTNYV